METKYEMDNILSDFMWGSYPQQVNITLRSALDAIEQLNYHVDFDVTYDLNDLATEALDLLYTDLNTFTEKYEGILNIFRTKFKYYLKQLGIMVDDENCNSSVILAKIILAINGMFNIDKFTSEQYVEIVYETMLDSNELLTRILIDFCDLTIENFYFYVEDSTDLILTMFKKYIEKLETMDSDNDDIPYDMLSKLFKCDNLFINTKTVSGILNDNKMITDMDDAMTLLYEYINLDSYDNIIPYEIVAMLFFVESNKDINEMVRNLNLDSLKLFFNNEDLKLQVAQKVAGLLEKLND